MLTTALVINLIEKAELHQTDFGNFTQVCLIMSFTIIRLEPIISWEYTQKNIYIEFVCLLTGYAVVSPHHMMVLDFPQLKVGENPEHE